MTTCTSASWWSSGVSESSAWPHRLMSAMPASGEWLNQPFSWQVCDHDLPPGLTERLLAHGFAPSSHAYAWQGHTGQ
jgi:hypothetical protein